MTFFQLHPVIAGDDAVSLRTRARQKLFQLPVSPRSHEENATLASIEWQRRQQ